MAFTTTKVIGGGVLVEGTDIMGNGGSVILRSDLWNQVKKYQAQQIAEDTFNTTVEEFFKPLTEAADALRAAVELEDDDASVVILQPATEGAVAVPAKKIKLDPEGVVLQILEKGDTSQLRWVGGTLIATVA